MSGQYSRSPRIAITGAPAAVWDERWRCAPRAGISSILPRSRRSPTRRARGELADILDHPGGWNIVDGVGRIRAVNHDLGRPVGFGRLRAQTEQADLAGNRQALAFGQPVASGPDECHVGQYPRRALVQAVAPA